MRNEIKKKFNQSLPLRSPKQNVSKFESTSVENINSRKISQEQ
jgi:hypothetical protein